MIEVTVVVEVTQVTKATEVPQSPELTAVVSSLTVGSVSGGSSSLKNVLEYIGVSW